VRAIPYLATGLIVAVALAACGEPQPEVERTVHARDLTVESIRARALDAVWSADVFYTKATSTQAAGSFTEETWIDLSATQARVEQDGVVARIFSGDKLAELHDTRYVEVPYEASGDVDPLIVFTLPHVALLPDDSARDVRIDDAVVDGRPAIRVRSTRRYGGDVPGDETIAIYLDESFLPLRIERRGPGGRASNTTFQSDFVPRDGLAADFFSFDAVRARSRTPADDLRSAEAAGIDVFWLGEPFEDMVLPDQSRLGSSPDEPQVSLSYGPADSMIPSPCANIWFENAGRWSIIKANRADKGLIAVATVETAAGTFTVFEGSTGPRAPVTVIPLGPGPAPTPPAVPVAPEDTGVYYEAALDLDKGGGITVSPSCGPIGSNRYRSLGGLEHLLRALRAF